MQNNKLKVAWICHFSNQEFNQKLPLKAGGLFAFMYKLYKGREFSTEIPDFGVWNINALSEMKKYTDRVELHIIAPYPHLESKVFEYEEKGIYYHFFRPNAMIIEKLYNHFPLLYEVYKPLYNENCSVVKSLISKIEPFIVHLIGAENPYYSLSALDIPQNIKLVVQLQTLMSDPKFFANYPIDRRSYEYRANIEKKVIRRADYVGTTIQDYRNIILEHVNPEAKFLDLKLAVGEEVKKIETKKEYDFVYFARSISKAGDWAIESFIEASKMHKGITMLVVGGYAAGEKESYEKLLSAHGLLENVTFTGELPTHDNVLEAVAKARVALLPIKIDFIPGTIREANALGLPVVTSITEGTPLLNEKRLCALLSKGGDHKTMANNMIRVLEDPSLAEELVQNSYIRLQESYDNAQAVAGWVEVYNKLVM
jgi:glycosyltransferase involved in cell wall biosynthesis